MDVGAKIRKKKKNTSESNPTTQTKISYHDQVRFILFMQGGFNIPKPMSWSGTQQLKSKTKQNETKTHTNKPNEL